MRFWLGVVAAVILVSGASTAIYFANPDLVAPAAPPTIEASAALPEGKYPKAVADTKSEELASVPQFHAGESRFVIRNAGETDLELRPGAKSCTCVSVRFVGEGVAEQTDQFARLKPGQKTEYVLNWDTKDKIGKFDVTSVVRTNDPLQREMLFVVSMIIERDLVADPPVLQFGSLTEGQRAAVTCNLYSMIHDDVKITDPVASLPQFKVALRPLSAEFLAEKKAKCGVELIVRVEGMLPVGDLSEKVSLKTSLARLPSLSLPISAYVRGQIDATPPRVDFGVVTGRTPEIRKVSISAKGLAEGRTLKVLSVEPEFLVARLVKDPNLKVIWRLEIEIPPNTAPASAFRGQVAIGDDLGNKKLNIAASGTVTASPSVPVASAKGGAP